MQRAKTRLTIVVSILALVVAACGGDGTAETSPTQTSDDGTGGAPTEEPDAQDAGGAPSDDPGVRTATITVDGDAVTYALDDVTFSPVEGVDDLTFETCSPDFFGSGRFYAIGYAVDAGGELILEEDGNPGMFNMDLPPDDWEAAERDEPTFEIKANGLDIEIARPDEAAGGTMSWTIGDTTASGTATFVDFENTYTVEFDIVCEGSPTVDVGDLPDDNDPGDGGGGGFPLAGAGTGSFTADGSSFDNVDVYACEPFSFGQDPDPRDVSLLAFLGGTSGLEVEVSYSIGFDLSDGSEYEQINVDVFYSRSGDSGLEQFEGRATNDANGDWFVLDSESFEQIPLSEAPVVFAGDRMTGGLDGLIQTWPDEGAATVDVTYDFEVPSEVNEEC